MPISNRSAFLRWSTSNSATSRTAVYGPVRTVVWQGSAGDRRPYADLVRCSGQIWTTSGYAGADYRPSGAQDENRLNSVGAGDLSVQSLLFSKSKTKFRLGGKMADIVYVSEVDLERVAGPLRVAHLPGEPNPVYFSTHGPVAKHYG
jgi:hypothetical protein